MTTKRALVNSSGSISEIATTDSLLANGFATPAGTATQFLKADGTTDSTTYLKSNTTNAITTQTTFDAATATDGVVISQSSSGAALRVTNTGTGNSFVVEDSTNPDSTPFVIDANGSVGIGGTPNAGNTFQLSKNITGSAISRGIFINTTVQSDVTNYSFGIGTYIQTAATAFSTSTSHYYANQGTIGVGSILATQIGFHVESTLTGATNNYGVYSAIAAPTSGGTASSTVSTIASSGTTTTIVTTVAHGLSTGQTVTISATANATALISGATVTILTVGTTDFTLIGAASNTVGLSFTATGVGTGTGTVTINQQGSGKSITVSNSTTFTYTSSSATYAAIAVNSGTITVSKRYNFYAGGTADNYFAGNVGIGTLPTYPLHVVANSAVDGAVITQAGSGTALRVTNTGTGNSFVVEDSANPDSTPFIIDASGKVGIGISPTTYTLHVAGTCVIGDSSNNRATTISSVGTVINYPDNNNNVILTLQNTATNAITGHGSSIAWQVGTDTSSTPLSSGSIGVTKNQTWTTADATTRNSSMTFNVSINGNMSQCLSLGSTITLSKPVTVTNLVSGGQSVALALSNPIPSHVANTEVLIDLAPNGVGAGVRSAQIGAISTAGWRTDLVIRTATSDVPAERMRIDSSGNVIIGTIALSTSATSGFLWIPSCAGTPTGAPTAPYTNASALITDTTNGNLVHRVGSTWVTNVKLTGEGSALGWRDIIGVYVTRSTGTNIPTFQQVAAGFYWEYAYAVNDAAYYKFHINHDYAVGTNIFLHMHFMCSGTNTQPVVWQFTYSFAKGHNQANFDTVGTSVSKSYAMTTTAAYRHHIAEIDAGILSTSLEVDGILLVKCTRLTNSATENTDTVYGLCCDVHYQADRFATKNKTTNFYI